VVMVKDIMVQHILKANSWKRPIYLAVTVPDQMGLEKQLVFEGLVFRVHPDPQARRMDTARTMDNLDNKFRYQGFLDANGDWDTTVYKDEQSTRLLQNYAAARVQLGLSTYEEGKLEESRIQLEKARKMSPHFPGVVAALGYVYERLSRWPDAAAHYEEQLTAFPGDAVLMANLGRVKAHLGDTTAAVALLEKSIAAEPGTDFAPYTELVNILFARGDAARCVSLLEQWLRYHPDDQKAKSSLELVRSSMTHP
ncbi:MAG TPA: tetratricopeptide repeat protein, partial [Candidatus Eisenbacteria bacterium]